MASLLLVCLLGLALVTMAPAEIYRPAPATIHPVPSGPGAPIGFVDIPPCVGQGKDCEVLHPRWDDSQVPARTVPEPDTLALVAAAVALLTWRSKS